MGYIISGIKDAKEVKVGDTLTDYAKPAELAIKGFEDVKPMVFAGIYPVDTEDFEELREAMGKLQLNDASIVFEPESSAALGFGFRCGFLGMLHLRPNSKLESSSPLKNTPEPIPVPIVMVITSPFSFFPSPNSITPIAAASASFTTKKSAPTLDLKSWSTCVPCQDLSKLP